MIMNPLQIEATEFSPTVILSSEIPRFEISGESRPENTGKFYSPIIEWLSQYKQKLILEKNIPASLKKIVFEFKLDYFNSTSAKYIMDILFQLDTFKAEGLDTLIKWHYDAMDDDMKEAGEEFAKLIKSPIEFVEK